jgi:MoaA/NifB/PqqE/SkfB family radical SAM enzyme
MTVETAHRVLDQFSHPVRLTFIGGEPCLWLLRYPEILRRALGEGHIVHLITNGTLVARLTDFVNAFRNRPVSVQFSIDGLGKNYEGIRKRGKWSTVVNAIRLLHSKRVEGKNTKAFITTNYLLMRRTLEHLPEFIRFCAREHIDSISLTYAMIYESMVSRGEITEEESVYYHKEKTNAAVRSAIEIAKEEHISLSFPPLLDDLTVQGKQLVGPFVGSVAPGKSRLPPAGTICEKPWKEIFVNQDGTIVPCCCGPDTGPVVGHLNEGLEHVWNDRPILRLRKALVAGEFPEQCRCGINISAVGRRSNPANFFTRLQGRNEKKKPS